MTLRQKAIQILKICGVPIEINSYTDDLIKSVVRVIDRRTK